MKYTKRPYAHLFKTNIKEYNRLSSIEFRETYPEKFKAKDPRKKIKHNMFEELPADVIPVNNFPTYYARPNGEVWRDTRNVLSAIKCGKERVLRLTPTFNAHNNYWLIQPYQGGKKKAIHLHRFILTAFKGAAPEVKMECHHIDHDTSNNSIDNLMWVTRQQNADLVPRHHRTVSKKTLETGRVFSTTKWSPLYPQISELVNSGSRPVDIANKLGIPPNSIYEIINCSKRRNN
jgi:hypothetical protein